MRNIVFLVLLTVVLGVAGCSPAVQDNTEPQQEVENTEQNLENSSNRVIRVEGFNFGYEPSVITVQAGEEVTVLFKSNEGTHDFVIEGVPEQDIRTAIIGSGDTTTVDFSIDEPGEYTFYCSVGSHRERGMVGTIIVEE